MIFKNIPCSLKEDFVIMTFVACFIQSKEASQKSHSAIRSSIINTLTMSKGSVCDGCRKIPSLPIGQVGFFKSVFIALMRRQHLTETLRVNTYRLIDCGARTETRTHPQNTVGCVLVGESIKMCGDFV